MRSIQPLMYFAVVTVRKAAISPSGRFSIRLPLPFVLPSPDVWETLASVAPSNAPSLG